MKEQLEMEPEDSDPESSSDESYGQIDDVCSPPTLSVTT